jgi:hypothetical protein
MNDKPLIGQYFSNIAERRKEVNRVPFEVSVADGLVSGRSARHRYHYRLVPVCSFPSLGYAVILWLWVGLTLRDDLKRCRVTAL